VEEPLLARLPKPPFGNETVPLNAKFLVVAQDSDAFTMEDLNIYNVVSPANENIWYPTSWANVDAEDVEYILYMRPTRKEIDSTSTQTVYYRRNPVTGQSVEVGRAPHAFAKIYANDVYVIRRDNHQAVLATNVYAGDLKKLLARLQLQSSQCSVDSYTPDLKFPTKCKP
jgi:hypothetical protein